jgi:hypothetical protein
LTTEEGGSQAIATLRLKVEDRRVSAVAVREQEEALRQMDAGRQPHRADFLTEIVLPTWRT